MENSRGFTLIELLVVVAIVTLLPIIIISNFPQVKLQFALSRSAYKFAQDVRRAQDLSLSSAQYKDSFGIFQDVAGYGIYVDASNSASKKYILYADRTPGNHQYDALDYIVETDDLALSEPGVIIQGVRNIFGNKASINFSSPGADVAINQLDKNSGSIEIMFALQTDTTKIKSIVINTSGLVEIK